MRLAGRLALRWGILDVNAWLKSLPAGSLDYWLAFDRVEPIGEERLQHAELMQQVAAQLMVHAKIDLPEVEDFMPARFERTKKQKPKLPDQSQMKSMFNQIAKTLKLDKVAT